MWLPNSVIAEIQQVARVHYINQETCRAWNNHRDKSELRLMTGWAWTSRDGRHWKQSLKSQTAAYIDAWYALVARREAPPAVKPRVSVVHRKVA